MDALTGPFEPAYMQRAWLELALLSVTAGALGTFVVLRRLAFATHALGVGTFPGVVVAFGLGASAFAGGLAAAAAIAALLTLLQRRRELDAPAATGLVLAGALALGSVLVSDVFAAGAEVDALLFGSLLGVSGPDVARSAAVAAGALAALALHGRGWLVVAFDREHAPALGFAPLRLDAVLLGVLAVAVVASVDAVGSLLVSSLFVVPAALGRLLLRRLLPLLAVSAGLALLLSTAGLMVAFHAGAPPGATIAALAAGAFALVYALRALAGPRRRRLAAAAAAGAALLALAGCGDGERRAGKAGSGATVVATTPIVADWARVVGGEAVEVVQLLDPEVDPHDYEPTPKDAAAVAEAAVVLASGAGLDAWVRELVEGAGAGAAFVEVAPVRELRPPALEAGEGDGEAGQAVVDPHFWLDPTLAAVAVRAVERALARALPGDAAAFAANADAYVAELEALDAELAAAFEAVPKERRKMVTDHDAFGYLAARYGIAVVGAAIPASSTAAEPSAADTARLVDAIRREGVRTVFSEASVDPGLAEQIAAETGAEIVPELYGDTLGPVGSGASTYLEMMRHDARVLVEGFLR